MRAALFVVVLAGTAHAQAPGEVQPLPAPHEPSVMDRRWSISAAIGPLGLKPKDTDRESLTFSMLELGGHFRIRPFIDVGVSFYGAGATKGELSTGGLFIDARWRFLAERPWNLWALFSLGVASVADEGQSEAAKQGRGAVRLGFGIERRFRNGWAIHAELRLVGIGENKDFEPMGTTLNDEMADRELSGGSLTMGGSFHF